MPRDETLQVVDVHSYSGLRGLAKEWDELVRSAESSTPFQSPAWIVPWWDTFGNGELWSVAFRHKGRLVGLAPLYISDVDGRRALRFVGTGNSDYLDLIVEDGFEAACSQALLQRLAEQRAKWDFCDFHQLQEDSPMLHGEVPAGLREHTTAQDLCPQLRLTEGDPAGAIPQKFYKQVSYYRRRTAREGEVSLERADEESTEDLTEALFRLHGARWQERDETGVLDGRAVRGFHRRVIEAMRARGLLRLYGLRLGGRLVAVYYGFLQHRRAYYYLSGFDPNLSKLSLGHQVVCHAIEEAHLEGAEIFDFLRGSEDYKYRWGCSVTTNKRRQIFQGLKIEDREEAQRKGVELNSS